MGRCIPLFGKQVRCISRPSGKVCSTVGGNVRHYSNSIMNVLGSSSYCASGSMLREITSRFVKSKRLSTICKSVRFVRSSGPRGIIHCCSSTEFDPQ